MHVSFDAQSLSQIPGGRMRASLILIFTWLAIFWLVFSIIQYLDEFERAAVAGLWLFVLSMIALWLPTGIFRQAQRWISFVVLLGWIAILPRLFPNWAVYGFPIRLSAYLIGFVSLVTIAAVSDAVNNRTPERQSSRRDAEAAESK